MRRPCQRYALMRMPQIIRQRRMCRQPSQILAQRFDSPTAEASDDTRPDRISVATANNTLPSNSIPTSLAGDSHSTFHQIPTRTAIPRLPSGNTLSFPSTSTAASIALAWRLANSSSHTKADADPSGHSTHPLSSISTSSLNRTMQFYKSPDGCSSYTTISDNSTCPSAYISMRYASSTASLTTNTPPFRNCIASYFSFNAQLDAAITHSKPAVCQVITLPLIFLTTNRHLTSFNDDTSSAAAQTKRYCSLFFTSSAHSEHSASQLAGFQSQCLAGLGVTTKSYV